MFIHASVLWVALMAQGQPGVDVSAALEPIVAQYDLPGMAVVVIQGDRVVASGVTGVRRRGSDQRITLEDQFHIGSDTKAFTATLCAMLVEDGKSATGGSAVGGLRWDITVGEVFPALRQRMDPAWRDVTLEQLLTNRSGAPENVEPQLWAKLWKMQNNPVAARRALLEGTFTHPPAAPPGTKYIYSNTGFSIAGHMAETVMGKPWEQLVTERIFKPLGMASAGFGPPGSARTLDQPRGHQASGQPVEPGVPADNPPAIAPAGRIHCSLPDWAKFVAWHLNGERDGKGLLKPESFRLMHTPVGEYAMGWAVLQRPWAGGTALTHSGSNTMWFAVAWLAPEKRFAVLVACNQGDDAAARACDEAAGAMIERFVPK